MDILTKLSIATTPSRKPVQEVKVQVSLKKRYISMDEILELMK